MGCGASIVIQETHGAELVATATVGAVSTSWFSHLYARYLPTIVIERFSQANAAPLITAEREFFEAAVAFVDISGFTKLSESLAVEYGDNGAEVRSLPLLPWGGCFPSPVRVCAARCSTSTFLATLND